MALPYLHRSKKVKNTNKNVVLDYKNVDPMYEKYITIGEKEAQGIIEKARSVAEKKINDAKQEATEVEGDMYEHIQKQKKELIDKEKRINEELLKRENELNKSYEEKVSQLEDDLKQKEIELEKNFKIRRNILEKEIRGNVYEEVKELAIKDSLEECERLVGRVQIILNEAIKHRTSVFAQVEEQITDLVLLIAKKVVKTISEAERSVVIKNVVEALKSLKGREHFIIRLNVKDLGVIRKHMSFIQESIEKKGNITLAEDSSVDPGGCVIETEFGEVDARISSHMQKIEQNIREAFPLKI